MNIRPTTSASAPLSPVTPVRNPVVSSSVSGVPESGLPPAVQRVAGKLPGVGSKGVADTLSPDEQLFFERMFASDATPALSVSGYRREGHRPAQHIGTVIDRRG